ncbi:MAG: hypothetical protein J2P59_02990, partial [Acidimicrobiales bacterium]|nr:hypothetical protein [Acidimicrobiales bacterium]
MANATAGHPAVPDARRETTGKTHRPPPEAGDGFGFGLFGYLGSDRSRRPPDCRPVRRQTFWASHPATS